MSRKGPVRENAASKRARLEAQKNADTRHPHADDDTADVNRSVGAGTDVATVIRHASF